MKQYIIFAFILLVVSACGKHYSYNHSHNNYNRFLQDRYLCIKESIAYADLYTASNGKRSIPLCSIMFNCLATKGYSIQGGDWGSMGNGKFSAPPNAKFYCND